MANYTLVHSGNRDSFKVAEALVERNRLHKLVTDDYFLLRNKPQSIRDFVKINYRALLFSILIRIFRFSWLYSIKDQVLSIAALKEARESNTNLFCYSYYANDAFSENFSQKKILFQLHPHPISVRNIFLSEIAKNSLAKESLSQEHELNLKEADFNKMVHEPQLADYIVTASSFTEKTLVENGISADKIKVIPYGVNVEDFKERKVYNRSKNSLNVIFVGSLNQRKGLSYLAEACKLLEDQGVNIALKVIGRGIIDEKLVSKYKLTNTSILHDIPKAALIDAYKTSDVFVLPSLCEGFGQVVLEAMATGLPVITTENTAGPDLITEDVDGYIVPVGDSQAIADRLIMLYNDPDKNIAMGKAASMKAQKFTWQLFKQNLNAFLNQIE